MLKRFVSVFLIFCLILSISISVCADDVNGYNVTNIVGNIETSNENPKLEYDEYIESIGDFHLAKENIDILKDSQIGLKHNEKIDLTFENQVEGMYMIKISYTTSDNSNESLNISCKIDGQYPYEELSNIIIPRYFSDIGEVRVDNFENEISKQIEQISGKYDYIIKNENNTHELMVNLTAGQHVITLNNLSEDFVLNNVSLIPKQSVLSYADYLKKYESSTKVDGFKFLECENTLYKTSPDLVQLSDNSSANVYPSSSRIDKINYIGGKNWDQPGETITWEIDVPKDGLYQLGLNYRQNYSQNTTHYREIKIDGEIPFEEAKIIELPYALNWTFKILSDKNEKPYLFFLTKGKHTISFSVTLGNLSEVCNDLEDITYDIAALYRSIIMITGDTPDDNRDYNLFDRVEGFSEKLNTYSDRLNNVTENLSKTFGSDSASSISTVNAMTNVLTMMKEHKYTAHKYINRYYDCYASLSSMLMELKSMPLDIDRLYYGNNFENTKVGFFKSMLFSIERFIYSFVDDYDTANRSENQRKKLTLWVNWGRDQAKVLKYLIQSDFSVKNNIDVDIKITNATLTHAALSGNGPDCQLHLSRSEPVNLAMRNAVYDLTKFEDYEEVASRFMASASDCYKFQDGVYALPDTQTFFLMFIRTDIFEDLGLTVPKTWEDFINTSTLLLRQNMQVGLPYTQIAEMTQVNLGVGALSIYPTLLIQNGGSLYNENHSEIKLLSEVSIDTFTQWTDFYTKYGFPKTYDFFNRFRLGLMPMAIQNYTSYATITAAAPEIEGCWEMYEIPGVNINNTINNITTGGGTGAVILSASKHKDEAWEFIKWWTSSEIQYQYGTEVENILGPSARVATANVKALQQFSWNKGTINNILSQWEKVVEMPEVPGGYYVSRVLDQAFWNVTNASENPKDMLLKWNDIAQTEVNRKREQYNIQ